VRARARAAGAGGGDGRADDLAGRRRDPHVGAGNLWRWGRANSGSNGGRRGAGLGNDPRRQAGGEDRNGWAWRYGGGVAEAGAGDAAGGGAVEAPEQLRWA